MTQLALGWTPTPLGDLAEFVMGQAPPGDSYNTDGNGVPFVRAGEFGSLRPAIEHWTTTPLKHARTSDVLICVVGATAGKVNLGVDASIGRSVAAVRPRPRLDQRFLYHFLTSQVSVLRTGSRGSAQGVIARRDLQDVLVPVPPLDEQQGIVSILEDHLSRLDAADAYLDASQRRLDAFRSAVLGEVMEGATGERCQLSDLVARIEAGRSFGGSAPPAGPDEWGIVKVSAMTWGQFRPEENKAVPAARVDPRFEIHPGDLLVSRANTSAYVGASVLVGDTRPRLLLSDKSLRIIPASGVDPSWLHLALSAPAARGEISARATGTKDSMRNISQPALLAIQVPRRAPADQVMDAIRCHALLKSTEALKEAVGATQRRAAPLRRAVLALAFSGRLTGRASDMDLAEELVS